MAPKLPNLKYKKFDGFYQLTEKFTILTPIKPEKSINYDFYSLQKNGLLILEKGYSWNGANVIIDWPDVMTASAIHDAFCQMVNDHDLPNSDRWKADDYWSETLKMAGVKNLRKIIYAGGVKAFGEIWYRQLF